MKISHSAKHALLVLSAVIAISVSCLTTAKAIPVNKKRDTSLSTAGVQFTPIPSAIKSRDTGSQVHQGLGTALIAKTSESAVGRDGSKSLWEIFIKGFLGGFAAFLLPCVYPLLPLTVGFFTKQAGNRAKSIIQSLIYGLSIIFIYVVFGLIITLIFGPAALNGLATNGIFNFFFFLLLLVFGISFLGAFEIMLPASFANKLDEKSDKGGMIGIFFMASTLVVISFSCTGPAIGLVLVDAVTKGERLAPIVVMLGFSMAIAIPFTLFAMFPSALKRMPKSGSWLNSVKVFLAFLEIGFSLKYLSNVDLAYHWNWFDREIMLSLWISLTLLLGLYLLGKIKFSHDSEVQHLSIPRTFFAIITFSFLIYLVPGLWGAPLKSISAMLPPLSTQDFDLSSGVSAARNPIISTTGPKRYEDIFRRLPKVKGIEDWYDYDQALGIAQKLHKPLLIDFTGWNCVNCRQMEQNVFPDPQVLTSLQNDFVVVQMVIDDKTELPVTEQKISAINGKTIKTIGEKNLDMEITNFNSNAQPYYVIADLNGKALVEPRGSTTNIAAFLKYLESGKNAFKNK
jgi:thiol:disulfide interchange protein DsbD